MKKILAVSSLAFLASCSGGSGNSDKSASPYTRQSVTSTPAGTSPTTSPTTTSSAVMDSVTFLAAAYQDGLGEIALSQLALQNSSDANVKAFAERMIGDHTQANQEITRLTQAKGITLPTVATTEEITLQSSLGSLTGIDFDRAYIAHNVTVHEVDVGNFRMQALSATDADVKTFALNTLPALQVHLLTARGIEGSITPAAFLINAFQDSQAEIQSATLTLQKSTNPTIRDFAQQMIDDHTVLKNEITQLAQARNIILPTILAVEHQSAYNDMSNMTGTDFEKAYMNHNVLVHELDVTQATAQSQNGSDADIKAAAAAALPILERHRQMAIDIYADIIPSLLFAAFQDGMGEILLSNLALQKSSNVDMQQYAQTMINDHNQANAQVLQLAQAKNLQLPYEISPEQLLAYINLSRTTGADFDKKYIGLNVTIHQRDVQEFQDRSANEPDADIRAFATATLPVLTTHLNRAQQIDASLPAAAGAR